MSKVIIFILIVFVEGCISNQRQDFIFDQIDYTYDNGWKEAFSLRLSQDGSCIVAKGRWENKQYFSCIIDVITLQKVDSIYRNVLACNPDSVYQESIEDGGSYKIVDRQKSFYVYGGNEPACLKEFSNVLHALTETKLNPIDTALAFKSLESFYPPTVKLDSAEFLPPTQQTER